jgi:hypothetical protein
MNCDILISMSNMISEKARGDAINGIFIKKAMHRLPGFRTRLNTEL